MSTSPEVSDEALSAYRQRAEAFEIYADQYELRAKTMRRRANAARKTYEDALLIHEGQMTLPYDEEA
jgi:hypothetical protein